MPLAVRTRGDCKKQARVGGRLTLDFDYTGQLQHHRRDHSCVCVRVCV